MRLRDALRNPARQSLTPATGPTSHDDSDLGNATRRSILSQVACELVTNAVVHSRSGEPGGRFTVTAAIAGGRLRVGVRDDGGPWTQPVRSRDGQHGRGLLVVGQLARDWGRAGDSATGWTIWFTMNLATPPATARPRHPAGEITMTEPGPAAQYDPQRLDRKSVV